MKESYINKNFRQETLIIIDQANEIIEEYQNQGMDLTLRQLYYQFVSRDIFENIIKNYTKLSTIISDARLAGLLDWEAIVDRTRSIKGLAHWNNPGEIIRSAYYSYRLDKWKNQKNYIEVWIEKEALIGVIASICNKLDIDFFACKGYVSQSAMWQAAQRFLNAEAEGKKCTIIHLGDHDPSGIDMTRDIFDRQYLFHKHHVVYPDIKRIALNMDQIEEYNPPPNPAKLTDTRANEYIARFGKESWELDALNPTTLQQLIKNIVLVYRDENLYQETVELEKQHKDILQNISDNWENL